MRYQEGKLIKTDEATKEDETKTEETVTMNLLAQIASSFFKFLQFTHEVAKEGTMIPILDMQIGVSKKGVQWPLAQLPRRQNGPRQRST